MTAEEKAADEAVDMTNCSLSKIILEHMDINKERDDRKREEKEEQEEEFDSEEEVKSSNNFFSSNFPLSDTAEKSMPIRLSFKVL